MINTSTIKFKEELTLLINNSQLPPINILLVMDSIQKEVNDALITQIQNERKENCKGEE